MKLRKEFIRGAFLVISICTLLLGKLCPGSSGELAAKKKSAEVVAKMAISKLQEKGKGRQIDVKYLGQKMSNNSASYQKRKGSWDKLRQEEGKSFQNWYQEEVGHILKGLNRDRPEGVKDYFAKEKRDAYLKCPAAVKNGYLNKNFSEKYNSRDRTTVFDKAREMATSLQWGRITKNIYPTESEIDVAVSNNKLDQLRESLLNKIVSSQKEVVFSENEEMLSGGVVGPIVKDAKEQLERQRKIVDKSDGGTRVVPGGIKGHIEDEIADYQKGLAESRKEKAIAGKVYKTFASIQKRIKERTDELAGEKFRDTLSRTTSPVGKDKIEALIKSRLSSHINRSKSREDCLKHFQEDIVKEAIGNHAAKAPEDKQASFGQFLRGLLSNDKSCQSGMDRLVARSLRQDFDDARDEISREQFKEFFGPLERGLWKPSEKEIDSHYSAFSVTVSKPLKMPGISSKSFDSTKLLEETLAQVREAEKTAIGKGLKALRDQMDTVERLEPQMKNQIKNMSDLTIEKVIEIYTQKVNSSWSSRDYSSLFTRTQKEIKRRAKDILDLEIKRQAKVAANKARADKARADARADKARADARAQLEDKGRSETLSIGDPNKPGKPGGGGDPNKPGKPGGSTPDTFGGPPGGKGPAKEQEELGDEMPDVILDFGYGSGRVYSDIMFPKESKDKIRLFMDLDVNLNSSNMIIAQKLFAGWLKDVVKRSKKDQQEINLYVFARVFQGNFVLYRMVYYFRECLIGALKDTGDKRIKIHWYDKLFDEPDDIEKYRGKPILPPNFDKKTMPRLWKT